MELSSYSIVYPLEFALATGIGGREDVFGFDEYTLFADCVRLCCCTGAGAVDENSIGASFRRRDIISFLSDSNSRNCIFEKVFSSCLSEASSRAIPALFWALPPPPVGALSSRVSFSLESAKSATFFSKSVFLEVHYKQDKYQKNYFSSLHFQRIDTQTDTYR